MQTNRPTYNLKAVMKETGLTAETLRAWERRYGLVKPKRSPGGHRLYSFRDIQTLKWLVQRQQEGMSISRAIELWRSLEESGQDPIEVESDKVPSITQEGISLDDLRHEWIEACLKFNEQAAEKTANLAFAVAAPETVCVEVFQKGLSTIGESWYKGKISVQQEHFASAIAMRRMYALLSASPLPTRSENILLACPPEEDHEFGLLLCAVFLRRRGWGVVYLGANVPLYRLEEALLTIKPALVVSLAQSLPSANTLREMGTLLAEHKIKVAYGGRVFNNTPNLTSKIPGIFLGSEIEEIVLSVEKLAKDKSPLPEVEKTDQKCIELGYAFVEKSPNILGRVNQRISLDSGDKRFADELNRITRDHLPASLALGDVCYIIPSYEWFKGYLSRNGGNQEILQRYLKILTEEVDNLLPDQNGIITACIENYLAQAE
jgi:MerR family transcriptional regulator, light-induced transcriptional regulator